MRHHVRHAIEETLSALKASGQLKLEAMPKFNVDPPKQEGQGDFASNVAMVLSKAEGKRPAEIAQLVAQGLKSDTIAKVEIAGPGFLNFTLSDKVIQGAAREVLQAGDAFGRAKAKTGQKVMVEFVSANPTGPIHIGHARGTFMGDGLARLLEAAGHDVTREFYINDYGAQVEKLGRAVFARYRELFGQKADVAEYPGEYIKDIAQRLKERDGDKWLSAPDAQAQCAQFGIAQNMIAIRATLARAGVHHEVFSSEAALHASGAVTRIIEEYKRRGATYEADEARNRKNTQRTADSNAAKHADKQLGGTYLVTGEHGDEEDRILVRKDGTPVYLSADLAYHQAKYERGFNRMVVVLGADHSGHPPRMLAGMKLLGLDPKKLDYLLVQMMHIVRDGEEVKISKRRGTVYELDDLLDDVGADACRFIFLMKTATTQFDFDLDKVKEQSSDNPVFYFQYGHARCAQILKKAVEAGKPFVGIDKVTDEMLSKLVLPEERTLLKKMSLLPDMVAGAAEALEPHRVLYFCQELIAGFHGYYTKYKNTEKVITDDPIKTQGRLAMVAALKQTLKSAFNILGVSAPEYMEAPPDEEAA